MLRIMNKAKKIKLFLGSSYLTVVGVFLWFFFNNFTIDEITSYEFIKKNSELLNDFTENNLLKISIIFSLFTIVWVLLWVLEVQLHWQLGLYLENGPVQLLHWFP